LGIESGEGANQQRLPINKTIGTSKNVEGKRQQQKNRSLPPKKKDGSKIAKTGETYAHCNVQQETG